MSNSQPPGLSAHQVHKRLDFAKLGDVLATHWQKAHIVEKFGNLPIRFEANAGQADARVKFSARGSGYNLFIAPDEATLVISNSVPLGTTKFKRTGSVLKLKLEGADPAAVMNGVDALPGKVNYLIGRDSGKWRTNVITYTRVKATSVYPGIDLVWYGSGQRLEYDFVVQAGADPGQIRLRIGGAQTIEIAATGDLVLETPVGAVRQPKPVIYEQKAGGQQRVDGRYMLLAPDLVGFEVGEYDRTRPLVIDPVLLYSTYLGGTVKLSSNIWGNLGGIGWTPKQVLAGDTKRFEDAVHHLCTVHPVIEIRVHAIWIELQVVMQHAIKL